MNISYACMKMLVAVHFSYCSGLEISTYMKEYKGMYPTNVGRYVNVKGLPNKSKCTSVTIKM